MVDILKKEEDKKIIPAPGSRAEMLYDPKERPAWSIGQAVQSAKKRNPNLRIGFTNGKFRVLHPAHCIFLTLCRSRCDILVVGINSDYSLRLLGTKSEFDAKERAFALGSLNSVDYVTIFDEETPHLTISSINPDVVFKGPDYAKTEVISAGKPVEILQHPFDVHASDLNQPTYKFFDLSPKEQKAHGTIVEPCLCECHVNPPRGTCLVCDGDC